MSPNRTLAVLFVLLTLPLCLFLALAVPFGEVPDEHTHLARAAGLLGGALFGHASPEADPKARRATGPGFDIDPAFGVLGRVFAPGDPKIMDAAVAARIRAVRWSDETRFVRAWNMALYAPVFYGPAVAGLGAAKAMALSPYHSLLAGRLANAAAFMALATAALLLARRGAVLLFAVLALPMSLALAASFNQDGLVIAAATLAVALLTRCLDGDATRNPAYAAAAMLVGLVTLARPALLPLALLLLLPVAKTRLGALVLAVAPALLWTWAVHGDVPMSVRPPAIPGALFPGPLSGPLPLIDASLQSTVFMARPWLALRLPLTALAQDWQQQLQMAVGVLGTLDVVLPGWLYRLWYTALGSALAATFLGPAGFRLARSALVCVVLFLCVVAIFDLLYLTWTPLGATHIEGVQGRYLLPLLPALALAIPGLGVPRSSLWRTALTLPPLAAAAADLAYLPQLILRTYYLH